jgi:phenylpropionate dioxygenase-like ring-hydroxylating dioxygenase large terminal subunit
MTRQYRRLSAVTAAVAAGLLFGCSDSASEDPTPTPTATEPTESPDDGVLRHSYTVRGKVVTVPSAERPIDDLEIRHEAITDYKNREGEVYVNSKGVSGMMSMTMGFPVAAGVSLEGIAPGDIVEFTFVTTWGEKYPNYEVIEIKKLPADTELNFGG